MSPGRHVRTRLYFTSESHVHSLLNVFRYGGLLDVRQSVRVLLPLCLLPVCYCLNGHFFCNFLRGHFPFHFLCLSR